MSRTLQIIIPVVCVLLLMSAGLAWKWHTLAPLPPVPATQAASAPPLRPFQPPSWVRNAGASPAFRSDPPPAPAYNAPANAQSESAPAQIPPVEDAPASSYSPPAPVNVQEQTHTADVRIHWLLAQTNGLIGEIQNMTNAPMTRLFIKASHSHVNEGLPETPNGYCPGTQIITPEGQETLMPGKWAKFTVIGTLDAEYSVYIPNRQENGSFVFDTKTAYEDNDRFQQTYADHHIH